MGALAASSLAIPGGVIIVGGAIIAVVVGIAINYLFTKLEIGGNTIEGHLNDFVDWLIFWDQYKNKGNIKMGFKRNITITLACVITECLISLIPMIFMIYLFFMMNKISKVFSTVLIVPYFILIINVILIIISFIAQLFIKTKYYVKDEYLIIKAKTKIREINYDEIVAITYDFGNLTRFNIKPSQLVLFDKNYKQLLSVNNPSLIMVYAIRRKCKHAKLSYYHNKRFLYLLLLINGIALFISILVKLFFNNQEL